MIQYKSCNSKVEVLSCTGNFVFKPHIHNRFVLWMSGGSGENFRVKGSSDILNSGHLSIFEPGLVHENHSSKPEERTLRSFYIDQTFLDQLTSEITDSNNKFTIKKHVIKNKPLFDELSNLHENLIQGLTDETEFLITLSKFVKEQGRFRDKIKIRREDKRVKDVIDYMFDNCQEKITLNDLSKISDCTNYHLIRIFKKKTGITPHQYLMQIRLEKAKDSILNGDDIIDVSYTSGFSDQSHLSRCFKSRFGITPKKFSSSS